MIRKYIFKYFLIIIGSLIYSAATLLFIFPGGLLLGGTSGISVILDRFLPFSSANILVAINVILLILAFLTLGKGMALDTFVGAAMTTAFIAILEPLLGTADALIGNAFLSAIVGAALIAVASGIMFFVGSSSGGTDIVALIIRKYKNVEIGRALLITDVLIVIIGGILSGYVIALASFVGLLVKTFGIDLVIALARGLKKNKK